MERKVYEEKKVIAADDHGLQQKIQESALGLDQYMQTLQAQSELLAKQKHDETLVQHIEERVEDTRMARHKLAKEAERKEAETLAKLKEARSCAKELMEEAKVEVREQESNPSVVERITETFTGKASHQIKH